MGAPNLQQQLYLKTALNESKDGMFDHPADLDEGYHKKALRLIRAGDWERAAEQGDRDEASALMRGGASERTMKAHFNNQDYAAGRKAMDKFEKAAAKKRKAALKAKGIADLEEGYQRKRMSVIRKAISSTGSGDRSQMKPEVADFLARSFKKKRMRNKVLSGGKGEVAALMVRARKKTAALKAKGLAEQSITEGLLSKLERLEEGYTSRGGYSKSMTSRILRDNSRSPENRAARAAARAAALKAAAARAAAAAKTPDTKN
jgi:hypothetical protein